MVQYTRYLKDKKTVVINGSVLRTQPNIYDETFSQKIVTGQKPLTIFADKSSNVNLRLGSKYTSD